MNCDNKRGIMKGIIIALKLLRKKKKDVKIKIKRERIAGNRIS